MPRMSVRTDGDAVGLTVTGGAFRLTFLPGVTGDSWMFSARGALAIMGHPAAHLSALPILPFY
jgi:hypothetical protein